MFSTRPRQAAPAILFFDELDALAAIRGAGLSSDAVAERVLEPISDRARRN